MRAFTRFAWAVLAYNLGVVAWGAFVRATGSGAGCGRHWPLCNGEVVPRAPAVATLIELAHRITSGLSLALVVALAIWAARALPRGHAARSASLWALALVVTEALVGAGLVLFGWVAKDASFARGWVMGVHLANTFRCSGPSRSRPTGARARAGWRSAAARRSRGCSGSRSRSSSSPG